MAAVASTYRGRLAALHMAVLLFGVAGLFGKVLMVPPIVIVAGRTLFAAIALGVLMAASRRPQSVRTKKDLLALAAMGILLALHWWTFFYAIRISTVAIGLLGFAAFPVFVTFLEPYLFKEKLRRSDVATAVAVTVGLAAVAWPVDLQAGRTLGVIWGVLSGLLFAVLSLFNRKYVQQHSPLTVACFQNCFACLVLLPALLGAVGDLSPSDWGLLVVLGVICTALAHALFISSLIEVRAQLAGVVAALEPVYGIVFAFILLGERPKAITIAGGILIVGTICAAMLLRQRTKPR